MASTPESTRDKRPYEQPPPKPVDPATARKIGELAIKGGSQGTTKK